MAKTTSGDCPSTKCDGKSYMQDLLDQDSWKKIPKRDQDRIYAIGPLVGIGLETMRCGKCGSVYLRSTTKSKIVGQLDYDDDGGEEWSPIAS